MQQPLTIGVSGGSGCGKTHFCREFAGLYKEEEIVLISADSYFKGELPKMISPLTGKEYDDWNSPESLNYPKLLDDVREALKRDVRIVLVEGAYIFCYEELRNMLKLKVFIDTDIELRLYRRIKRNMEIFQMEMDEIAAYFLESAKFQEAIYALPTKIYADLIFNGAKKFNVPVQILDSYVKSILQ